VQRAINRTPGQLVVAALICLYGGFLLVVVGFIISDLASYELGDAVTGLGRLSLFAVLFLLLAAIITSFDKKP
jgi:hypothetical protein